LTRWRPRSIVSLLAHSRDPIARAPSMFRTTASSTPVHHVIAQRSLV
jgi:hypothetical protein